MQPASALVKNCHFFSSALLLNPKCKGSLSSVISPKVQMAFSSLKPTGGPLPARLGQKGFPIKRPVKITTGTVLPLQVKSEEERRLEAPMNLGVSRRDMMIYLTAGALSGGTTDPVEARVVKPEIRRKIREKLEMLREKAGLSKPKNENGRKTSSEQPPAKEKKLPFLPPPIPSPNSEEPLAGATLS